MPLTIDSLNSSLQCVEFQLLKPIGGVRASCSWPDDAGAGSGAAAGTACALTARPPVVSSAVVRAPRALRPMTRGTRMGR